jgi:CheY-like chemotaxis protein
MAMAQNRSILLVDDDPVFRYAVMATLREAGYTVLAAPDYRDALKLLDSPVAIDLLLTDLSMPSVNGFALARMASLRREGLRVVYVTGVEVPLSEAMGPVLRKPVTDADLLNAVASQLADTVPSIPNRQPRPTE